MNAIPQDMNLKGKGDSHPNEGKREITQPREIFSTRLYLYRKVSIGFLF